MKTCDKCGKTHQPENEGLRFYLCPKCATIEIKRRVRWEYRDRLGSLPKIYRTLTDRYGIKASAEKFFNKSLYLWGDVGSGKTVLATMILKNRWRRGLPGRFLSYPRFIFQLQTDYDNSASEVNELMGFPGCLVLDDFGVEKLTDFVRQTSYLIIDYREQYDLQTVITSNFSLDEIDIYIDRRISSRICGMCEVVKMSGDKRLK